jgi:hypothetical protein
MPTPFESAQLNLQLFELRREPVLRDARTPCPEPVRISERSSCTCGSHPKMLYRVTAIYRSVTEADVFHLPTVTHTGI